MNTKNCVICGNAFVASSAVAKYCPVCRKDVKRKYMLAYREKFREKFREYDHRYREKNRERINLKARIAYYDKCCAYWNQLESAK